MGAGLSWAGFSLFHMVLAGLIHMCAASARVFGKDGEAGKAGINRTAEASLHVPLVLQQARPVLSTWWRRVYGQKQERAGLNPRAFPASPLIVLIFPSLIFSSSLYLLMSH